MQHSIHYKILLTAFFCSFLHLINTDLIAQNEVALNSNKIKIPVDLGPQDLFVGSKIKINSAMPVACSGGGNQSVGGFTLCADEMDATVEIDRNDWWNCCAPPGWLPSETYGFNFPSIESVYPCVTGTPVDELILTITIESVTFNLGSPYACCENYLEGLFANLYDNCPVSSNCTVVGDGLTNTTNPGMGDCMPNGDNLNYDDISNTFPLGIPFTSTTTCLASIIGTGDELGVDIVPSFRYDVAAANGCNCTQDLISQGLISVEYTLEVEFVFCSQNLPSGCYPSTFTPIGPLCETAAPVALPSVSENGFSGSWNPATINPAGQGGNTITAVFTPNPGQCVGGTSEMDVVINAATTPTFTQINPVCENASPIPLPSTSNNGINGSWNVGSTFNPAGQGGNTVTITFTPNAGLCAATQTMDIVVNQETTPSFTQIGPLCESDPPVALSSISNNGIAGSWDVGNSFNPAGQGGNTVTITFTPNAGQCAGNQTMDIMVTAETIPAFTQIGPLCEDDAPVVLPTISNNGVVGSWDVGATFDPSGQGGSTVTINFTPNGGQCAAPQSMDIAVTNFVLPSFDPIGPLCETEAPVALPTISNNGYTGNWDVGNSFDPAGLGGNTVTVNFTPNAGQCASMQSIDITVEAEVVPTFDPIGPLCESDPPYILPTSSNNGITGTWDIGPVLDPAGAGGATIQINFFPNSGECATTQIIQIFIAEAGIPTFDAIGPLCENEPPVVLPNTSNNGINGSWDVGNSFDPQGFGGNTVTINFSPDPGQCSASTSLQITVIDEVVPTFNPIGPLCENSGPVVLPTTSNNGISGSWDVGTVFDPIGQSGPVVINFMPDAGQCAAMGSMTIMVNSEIQPTFNALGPLCENDNPLTLPLVSNEGVTGVWDIGPTFDPSGQMGSSNIIFTPDAGQCAAQATVTITVNSVPTVTIVSVECNPGLSDYRINIQTDGNVVTSSVGTVTDLGGGMFLIDGIPEGTDAMLTITNSITGCETTADVSSPNCSCPTIAPPSGNDIEICEGSVIPPLTAVVGSGLEVDWYNAAAGGILLLGSSNFYTPNSAGTYFAEAIDPQTGCTSNTRLGLTLTIIPLDTTYSQAFSCDPNLVGTDTVIYTTALCDSVVITTTMLEMGDEVFQNATSCDPNNVGVDTLVLMNQNGCDSLVITNTVLSAADTTFNFATTCDLNEVGMDTVIFATASCDSLVITTTSLLDPDETFLADVTCNSNAVGLDTVYLVNQFGCDSLIITDYSFEPLDPVFLQATSCDPAELGMDTLVLTSLQGCDSLIITTITFSAADTTYSTGTTCDINAVGVDTLIYSTATCDSIVITTTTLMQGDETLLNAVSCDPNAVGMDTVFLSNQMGCDSLVITTTSLSVIDTTFAQATSCDINEIGLDTIVYSSGACDSVVIVNTLLIPGDELFLNSSSCDPNEVGIDTIVYTNVSGCDSLVITETVLSAADSTFLQIFSCDVQMVGSDTVVYSTATCDSIVITMTTLVLGSETFLDALTCDPLQVGLDTVILTNQNGCDSLVITNTALEVIAPTFLTTGSCDPLQVGIDSVVFNTSTCDSLVITTTVLLQPSQFILTQLTCVQSEVGSDTLFLTNQAGCDSLLITNTTLLDGIEEIEFMADDPDCIDPTGSIAFLNVTGGQAPYLYSIDGGATFSTEPVFNNLSSGDYEIFIEDAAGCSYEDEVSLLNATSLDVFVNPEEIELQLGQSISFNTNVTVPDSTLVSVVWDPTEFLSCSTCLEPTATPFETTEYTLTILDENGCQASTSVIVFVNEAVKLFAPNAFSPNGDGFNDVFTLYANVGYVDVIMSLKIFDRWGDNVFENYNFYPNDLLQGWNGEKDGKQVGQGVHVYVAELILVNGTVLQLEGEITVIR